MTTAFLRTARPELAPATPAGAAGGDLAGSYPDPTVDSLANVTDAAMDLAWVTSAKTWVFKKLANDQSVTSSVVLVDATGMSFAIGANETWLVLLSLFMTFGAGGQRIAVVGPAGVGGVVRLNEVTGSADVGGAASAGIMCGAVGAELHYVLAGDRGLSLGDALVVNGGTAGTVKLQFAQDTSNGTATVLKANSWLRATRVA